MSDSGNDREFPRCDREAIEAAGLIGSGWPYRRRRFHVRPRVLLGCARERAALSQLLGAARAGRSGVLVMHGEPGAGKTALLEWGSA